MVWKSITERMGIDSARYMGEDTSYHIKNANLIAAALTEFLMKRTARFVCAIAAAFPDGTVRTVRAAMEGRIGYEEKGETDSAMTPFFIFRNTDVLSLLCSF